MRVSADHQTALSTSEQPAQQQVSVEQGSVEDVRAQAATTIQALVRGYLHRCLAEPPQTQYLLNVSQIHEAARHLGAEYSDQYYALLAFLNGWINQDEGNAIDLKIYVSEKIVNCYVFQWDLLDLTGLGLKSLPQGLFDSLTHLARLYLPNNELTQIDPHLFDRLDALQILDLSKNPITELNPNQFSQLSSLMSLGITYTAIDRLREGVFNGLNQMEELILSNNEIALIDDGVFAPLESVQWILIENNHLTHLSESLIHSLPSCSEIMLRRNNFSLAEIDRLSAIENAPGYDGVRLMFDRTQQSFLSSAEISAVDLPNTVALFKVPSEESVGERLEEPSAERSVQSRSNLSSSTPSSSNHPLWAHLAEHDEMGSSANNLAIFLNRLYHESPREADQLNSSAQYHSRQVLDTLEQAYDQLQAGNVSQARYQSFMDEIYAAAEMGVGSCIDKIGAGLLMMSIYSQKFSPLSVLPAESGVDEIERFQEKLDRDIAIVKQVMQCVEDINADSERKLVFDTQARAFIRFVDLPVDEVELSDGVQLESLESLDNFHNFHNLESFESFKSIKIDDEVEDILQIVNLLAERGELETKGVSMRFCPIANLKGDFLEAAVRYVLDRV